MESAPKSNVVEFPQVANSLDDIKTADGFEYKEVDGFRIGQKVWIGTLSAGDMLVWIEAKADDEEAKRTAGLRLVSKSLVSVDLATGRPSMASVRYADSPEGIEVLKTKSHVNINRLAEEVIALNGLQVKDKPDAAKEAKKD